MKIKDTNTEHAILQAAEEIFLEKGYAASRTTAIAQLAGVNHAMLHYYFRSKENLFNKVFDDKVQLLASSFLLILQQEFPFLDKIKLIIEAHFDFLVSNPKIPSFILTEITTNSERKKMVEKIFSHKASAIIAQLTAEMSDEIKRDSITKTNAMDLILNIVSLNVFSIVASQLFFKTKRGIKNFLMQRKKNNVAIILKSLQVIT